MTAAETETATALYYTLSTIAQTLAGSLAILVAAVLFKLSSLSREQELAADTLRSNNIDPDFYLPIARKQGYDAMAEQVHTRTGWIISGHEGVRRACAAATAAYETWGSINLRLYAALATTVVATGVCFITLPFTPKLAASPWAPRILILSVGLGIVCLLLYVWLIYAMVKRPE
jgi:hypothetical protein